MRSRSKKALKIHPGELMAPWTFKVKFPYNTHYLFGTLMFTVGEDETLELLTWGLVASHYEPIYGEAPYYLVDSPTASASGRSRSGLNLYAGFSRSCIQGTEGHRL
jgi:hypothetical protein